jgi:hypothetical protein
MDKFQNIFLEIKKQIKYIVNDEYLIFSSDYFICLNEILYILQNALSKIGETYYKYIISPKLSKLSI